MRVITSNNIQINKDMLQSSIPVIVNDNFSLPSGIKLTEGEKLNERCI